jgi:hypothetical protein
LGGLPNNNLFKGGTNGANFVVALFALNLALSCAEKGFAKEATAKSPLHFLGLRWQLPPYYLLTSLLLTCSKAMT